MGKISIIGQKFGLWTVLSISDKILNKKNYVNCQCFCGTIREVVENNLKNGGSTNCGCQKNWRSENPQEVSRIYLYKQYQKGAERRNFCFDLNFEYFDLLINSPCHYCNKINSNKYNPYLDKFGKIRNTNKINRRNIDITYAQSRTIFYNGVDRKNPNYGYTIENCVACCKICNRAKSDMSYQDYIEWIESIKK